MANSVAAKLGLRHSQFLEGTLEQVNPQGPFDGIFMMDVLHHLPRDVQEGLLAHLRTLLAPRGVLLVKEVTTDQWFKLKFTELLDRAMVGFKEPLSYRGHLEWAGILRKLDLHTRVIRVPDILPYPHVILVARPHE